MRPSLQQTFFLIVVNLCGAIEYARTWLSFRLLLQASELAWYHIYDLSNVPLRFICEEKFQRKFCGRALHISNRSTGPHSWAALVWSSKRQTNFFDTLESVNLNQDCYLMAGNQVSFFSVYDLRKLLHFMPKKKILQNVGYLRTARQDRVF